MATRSQARACVAQLIYAYGAGNTDIVRFTDEFLSEQRIKNTQAEFAKGLFNGVLERLGEIDLRIAHQAQNWDFSRIGGMELAILRLGTFEILSAHSEVAIVINEALEIAKNFSNETSVKFINGVLDGVAKTSQTPLDVIKEAVDSARASQEASKQDDAKTQNLGVKNAGEQSPRRRAASERKNTPLRPATKAAPKPRANSAASKTKTQKPGVKTRKTPIKKADK